MCIRHSVIIGFLFSSISLCSFNLSMLPGSVQVGQAASAQVAKKSTFKDLRLVLTTALAPVYYEFRKEQYLETLGLLLSYGYGNSCYGQKPFYVVEAIEKSPTFFEEFTPYVFYATRNHPRKNHRINEARNLLESISYFNFDADDMIVKLTGRYQPMNNSFFQILDNEKNYDAYIKLTDNGFAWTFLFAMRCKFLKNMLESIDYLAMEKEGVMFEQVVAEYIKKKSQKGEMRVRFVTTLGIRQDIFGSTTNPSNIHEIYYH